MDGFIIRTGRDEVIRFRLYADEAPVTVTAFMEVLPFDRMLMHARVSGQEVWTDDGPKLDIIQENASVFTEPGEVVLGPMKGRAKTAGAIGIYYGEGKGLDAANIFAKVVDEDAVLLRELGERIWKKGEELVKFERG